MQYYVPQFIESESRVIGPLSLRQFFLIAGPVTFVVVLYLVFKNFLIVFIMGIFIVGGGIALALFKFHGQDLTAVLSYGIIYFLGPKKYFWSKKGQEKITLKEIEKIIKQKEQTMPTKRAEESRLKKISWEIQTKPKENEEKDNEKNLPLMV